MAGTKVLLDYAVYPVYRLNMTSEIMAVRTMKLPRKLLDEVIKRAERERRTVSAMMRILIEEAMKPNMHPTTQLRPPHTRR